MSGGVRNPMTGPRPGKRPALVIPSWVPQAVTAIAQEIIAAALVRPASILREYTDATVRLATDPRMYQVWHEVYRRCRHPNRGYVNATQERSIRASPSFPAIRDLAQSGNSRDRLQEQASALLFLEATGFFLWDQQRSFGPHAVTVAEITQQVRPVKELAERIRMDCEELKVMGMWRHVPEFEQTARSLDAWVLARDHPSNPYIVERKSSRIGSDWERGYLITMGGVCRALFGSDMLRTVRTLGNVALHRDDLTIGKVRGALRAPNKRTEVWIRAASGKAP
jgi:hypothetical protein